MSDVNVTEKVARALLDRAWGSGWEFAEDVRDAMHAALRRPDVLAGIAGVLRDAEDEWVRRYADAEGAPPTRSEFQAAAVVEWLAGGAR